MCTACLVCHKGREPDLLTHDLCAFGALNLNAGSRVGSVDALRRLLLLVRRAAKQSGCQRMWSEVAGE
jgi:hypothetical protein